MSRGEVAGGQQELIEFLRTAPPPVRGWAASQLAALDVPAGPGPEPGPEPGPGPAADDVGDQFDEDLADQLTTGVAAGPGGPSPARRRPLPGWTRSRPALVLLAVVIVAAVGVFVYQSGSSPVPGISGKPVETASASPSPSVDRAKVAELMQKLTANPRDVATLTALGDLYFQAGDYNSAATWQQKLLDVSPSDVTARLALGASRFNLGDTAAAERHWQQVVAQDAKNAEAHYDLGFLYLSQNPPNVARVRQEWAEVVRIDPNSQIARTVSTHLQSLATASASPAAAGPVVASTPAGR